MRVRECVVNVRVCEFVYMGVVGVCTCVSIRVHTCAYCAYILVYQPVYLVVRYSDYGPVWWDPDPFVRSEPGNRRSRSDPDSYSLQTRYAGDSKTDPWDDRPVPICTVKTRRRFGSKTVSFYVSICFHVIFLFTIINAYLCPIHIISCDQVIYYTSMFTCITSWDISEHSPYLFCWSEYLLVSFHV